MQRFLLAARKLVDGSSLDLGECDADGGADTGIYEVGALLGLLLPPGAALGPSDGFALELGACKRDGVAD